MIPVAVNLTDYSKNIKILSEETTLELKPVEWFLYIDDGSNMFSKWVVFRH